ncbi:flagellar basal body-associated protein FliL [Porticoccus sp.]
MAKTKEKQGKGKLFIIIAGVVLCLLTAANVYFLVAKQKGDANPAAAEQAKAEPGVAPAPIFVKVGPMTVNLVGDQYGQHLLYTSLTLKVDNDETRELLNTHMPEVHSRLLLLLSSKTAEELFSAAGKELLTQQVLAMFDQPLTHPQPPLAISSVLFSEFIVQ